MRALWEAAGARDLWNFQRFAHLIGTCRMGASADDSVVDRAGRVWDVASPSATTPSFPAVSLATRL